MISYDFFKPRLCTEKTQGFLPAGSTACGADGSVEGNGLGCRGNGLRNRGLRESCSDQSGEETKRNQQTKYDMVGS